MSFGKTSNPRSVGSVTVPATAIGSLSVVLVVGLSVLGILDHLNRLISKLVSPGGAANFSKSLPEWFVWLGVMVFAFGISFALLNIAGGGRRVIVWLSTIIVVAGWALVLSLAAHAPHIGGPWIATFWSGVCALIYAGNHRIPCDEISEKLTADTPDEAR